VLARAAAGGTLRTAGRVGGAFRRTLEVLQWLNRGKTTAGPPLREAFHQPRHAHEAEHPLETWAGLRVRATVRASPVALATPTHLARS